MYGIGKFFNKVYKNFIVNNLQSRNIESFIKVYSSAYRRCLESASALVTGLIGGSTNNQNEYDSYFNNLTLYWSPIPIKSFALKGYDPLLDVDFPCPSLDTLFHNIRHQDNRIQNAEKDNQKFFNEISFFTGQKINSLKEIMLLYQELYIEQQNNYFWWRWPYQIWTRKYEEFAIERLRELSKLYWSIFYDNHHIQRLIGGPLFKEINNNIRNYIQREKNNENNEKIIVYSTHDGKLISMLQALGIHEPQLISPGSTLVFELHENNLSKSFSSTATSSVADSMRNYYLKFYYYNETYSNDNWQYNMFPERICFNNEKKVELNHQSLIHPVCSLDDYFEITSSFEPTNIAYECGIELQQLGSKVNLILWITNGLLLLILIILLIIYGCIKYKI